MKVISNINMRFCRRVRLAEQTAAAVGLHNYFNSEKQSGILVDRKSDVVYCKCVVPAKVVSPNWNRLAHEWQLAKIELAASHGR